MQKLRDYSTFILAIRNGIHTYIFIGRKFFNSRCWYSLPALSLSIYISLSLALPLFRLLCIFVCFGFRLSVSFASPVAWHGITIDYLFLLLSLYSCVVLCVFEKCTLKSLLYFFSVRSFFYFCFVFIGVLFLCIHATLSMEHFSFPDMYVYVYRFSVLSFCHCCLLYISLFFFSVGFATKGMYGCVFVCEYFSIALHLL